MAKRVKIWLEGELINTFKLNRTIRQDNLLMKDWLDVSLPQLNESEQYNFEKILQRAHAQITGWNEEDTKMKFISPILELGHLMEDKNKIIGYFHRIFSAEIETKQLTVKSDFTLATGILDCIKMPYFHFQQYKSYDYPIDSMGQLLQAFLITQEKNKNNLPLYGVDVMRNQWQFVIMEGKNYCISKSFNSVDKTDLLTIIAVLRNFKYILETRLLID